MTVCARSKNIHIIGCGSALHAGMVGRRVIETMCRVRCTARSRPSSAMRTRSSVTQGSVHRHQPVGRDRRYVGRDAPGQAAGALYEWRSSTSSRRRLPARRTACCNLGRAGDRGRDDKGVFGAARRRCTCFGQARSVTRRPYPTATNARCARCCITFRRVSSKALE